MTVLTDKTMIDYVGDGVTTVFAYDFPVLSSDDLEVYIDSVLESPSNYSVSGIGAEDGDVTFTAAPAVSEDVRLKRVIDYTQLTDYRPYDPFPAETHETALDRIVMMIQQVASDSGFNVTSVIEGLLMPVYSAGEYLRWDTSSQILVNGTPIASTLNSATDSEVTTGTSTTDLAYSPAQLKLSVETHETPMVHAAVLPGSPDANTYYFIDE